MLKRISIATLCLLVTSALPANPLKENISSTYYQLGLELSSNRDDLLIPLAFNGPGLALGLGHTRTFSTWTLDIPVSFKFDFVFNRFNHPGALLSFDLNPTLLRSIYKNDKWGRFRGGLALPFKMNNQFIFSWDDAHLYWFTTKGVNLALAWCKDWSSSTTHVELSIPLITWISRPESYRYEKQDASLNWLGFRSPEEKRKYKRAGYDEYQAIALSLSHHQASRAGRWKFGFEYDHYTLPSDVWVLSTKLTYIRSFGKKGVNK